MNNFSSIRLGSFVLLSIYLTQQIQGLVQPPGNNNAKLPMIKCIAMEREALLSLKQSFVDSYGILSSWSNEESHRECCKWDHVHCSNITGHVIKLDLHGTNNESLQLQQGTISPSLTKLTHLQYLDLSFTDFLVNNIPNSISTLTNLRYLNLSYCYLGGNIPHEFGNLLHLQYLDLQSNLLYGEIPSQLSNLSNLTYLDLTFNDFSGTIPHQFGNLSGLQNLYIGPFSWDLSSNLEWLSVSNTTSSSLRVIRMKEVNLSSATNWPKLIASLPHLQELQLINCTLPNSVPFSVSNMNLSKSLTVVDLCSNSLTSSIYPWLLNFHTSLSVLKLTDNNLQGPIPKSFTKFSSLQELWLGDNQLEGGMVTSLWDLCNLSLVRLNDNGELIGLFSEFLPTFHHCARNSLKILDLGWNEIAGEFPNISHLSSLQELYLDGNTVNGTLSESVGQLSNLEVLSAYGNSLEGTITEAHFFNLSKLRDMDLTSNNLSFVFSADWIPPFQIQYLYLEGCNLGPRIPSWLKTQKRILWLDISNTGIADTVPHWLWEMSLSMQNTNFSHNQLSGEIPNFPWEYNLTTQIDLSSNLFHGRIPWFLSSARSLYLSNNNFTDLTLLLCRTELSYLFLLDLANNQIPYLPDCWKNMPALSFLNLANNKLSGEIPSSMGHLVQIQAIHLRDNRLTGELPIELGNCTELRILDVGYNDLSGPIPKWVGEKLQKLLVLIMQFNHFNDTLPLRMCSLSQIQILDLSLNNITGIIPPCVNNFTALASSAAKTEDTRIGYSYNSANGATYVQFDSALVTWKGTESEYKNTLGLVRSVDLSSNKFFGEIPEEITKLVGLVSLNLSRNMLSGKIPSEIGKLGSLDALDLSRNLLCGEIPTSIAEIHRVGVFDLSYNNLSGRIPVGTQIQSFNETCFIGNPELCGLPLPKTCPEDQTNPNGGHENDDDDEDTSIWDYGFCISLVVGFGVGFCGVCGTLALNRPWRNSYFKFMIDAYDQLHLVLTTTIVPRKLKEECFSRQESQSGDNNNYNKRNTRKSDYCSSSISCEYCGESGHLGENCHHIRASLSSSYHHAPSTGYHLDSGNSSNHEIVAQDSSGYKHGSTRSKAPIT